MFLRLLFLFRTVNSFTIFTDQYAYQWCFEQGFKNNLRFVFRCYFKDYPSWTVMVLFTGFVLIYAYIVRIFELPLARYFKDEEENHIKDFSGAIYLNVITLTTIGYGDLTPNSTAGRVTMMMSAALGALMTSLIIIVVSDRSDMNEKQLLSFWKIHQTQSAALCI